MKMNKIDKLCMMVAVIAIVFGVAASSSYGQETSSTDDSTAPANTVPLVAFYNPTTGYKIGGKIVLVQPGGYSMFNTALGYQALSNNTNGQANTANGYQALQYNTGGTSPAGSDNNAYGSRALQFNTTGSFNTASSAGALQFNTTGDNNVASGDQALFSNSTGSYNTATGTYALYNSNGGNNTAIGYDACYNLLTGSNVICIGSGAGPAADIPGPATYIAGIYGEPVGSTNSEVCIDDTGLLGTVNCPSTDLALRLVAAQKQIADFEQRISRLESLIANK
jgi:hypothetical protein